jgi:hypothetical protein
MDLVSCSFLLVFLLFLVLAGGVWVAITLAIIGLVDDAVAALRPR